MAGIESGAQVSAAVTRLIEWSDTDASGHYHYSTATRLFEAAESELLEQLGLLEDVYGRLPRVHVSFDFRRILFFRDLVVAHASVARLGRTSVTYSFEVRAAGELAIEGSVVATLIDDSGSPTPWSPQQSALLEPVRDGEPEPDS